MSHDHAQARIESEVGAINLRAKEVEGQRFIQRMAPALSQGAYAASSLTLSLSLAVVAQPTEFAWFSIGFGLLSLASAVQRTLVCQPILAARSAISPGRINPARLASLSGALPLLVLGLSLGDPVIGLLALAVPLVQRQDRCRYENFAYGLSTLVVISDLVWLGGQGLIVFAAFANGKATPELMVAAWMLGLLASTVVIGRVAPLPMFDRSPLVARRALLEPASIAVRWLFLGLLVTLVAGSSAYAEFRLVYVLFGAVPVLAQAAIAAFVPRRSAGSLAGAPALLPFMAAMLSGAFLVSLGRAGSPSWAGPIVEGALEAELLIIFLALAFSAHTLELPTIVGMLAAGSWASVGVTRLYVAALQVSAATLGAAVTTSAEGAALGYFVGALASLAWWACASRKESPGAS